MIDTWQGFSISLAWFQFMMPNPNLSKRDPSLGIPPRGKQLQLFRNSCDHCAKSKVRCDKEKPACGRCALRHLPCKYGLSCRAGPFSRNNNRLRKPGLAESCEETPGNSAMSESVIPTQSLVSSLPGRPDVVKSPPRSSMPSPGSITLPFQQSTESRISSLTEVVHPYQLPVVDRVGIEGCSTERPSTPGAEYLHTLDFVKCEHQGGNIPSVQDLVHLPLNIAAPKVEDLFPAALSHPTSCAQKVLEAFQGFAQDNLHPCKYSSWQCSVETFQVRNLVLSRCRRVIESVAAALECPCSADEHTLAVISAALINVSDWYISATQRESIGGIGWPLSFSCHASQATECVLDEQESCRNCFGNRSSSGATAGTELSQMAWALQLMDTVLLRLECTEFQIPILVQ